MYGADYGANRGKIFPEQRQETEVLEKINFQMSYWSWLETDLGHILPICWFEQSPGGAAWMCPYFKCFWWIRCLVGWVRIYTGRLNLRERGLWQQQRIKQGTYFPQRSVLCQFLCVSKKLCLNQLCNRTARFTLVTMCLESKSHICHMRPSTQVLGGNVASLGIGPETIDLFCNSLFRI